MLYRLVLRRIVATSLAGVLAAALIGCGANGGQTGDGSPARPAEEATSSPDVSLPPSAAEGCTEERRLAVDPDETTELGFSATQAAEAFALEETRRLSFSQGHALTPPLEPEVSELLLRVTPEVAASVVVKRLHAQAGSGDCSPYLELPVTVDLRTTALALDESFSAKLELRSLDAAWLSYTWKGEELTGDWGALLNDAGAATIQLQVRLTNAGSSGALYVHLVPQVGGTEPTHEGPWTAARWSAVQ